MKFLHISDTHLGYNQYGLVERGRDFFDAFNEAVDIAVEKKVDFIIHTGDFFHSSRPPNRILVESMEILKRLKERNIPLFTISGNHDRGVNVRDLSPLNVLETVGLKLVDQKVFEYEGVFISGIKYISKAGLRHLGGLRDSISRLLDQTGDGFKILMLHQEFYPQFPESQLYLQEEIVEGFDYIGIGHFHISQDPFETNGAKVVYPGSTEYTAYHEAEEKKKKGVYLIEVNEVINCEFIPLKSIRPFLSVKVNDENFLKEIENLKGKIEHLRDTSEKPPVLIIKGNLKEKSFSDFHKLLVENKIDKENGSVLHINFNITKELEDSGEKIFIDKNESQISNELKRLLDDEELFETVSELINQLKSFDNIDEAKKYIKENPEILEI